MGCLKKGEGITKMLNEGYQIKLIWRLFGSHQIDCETMNPFWTRTGEFLPVLKTAVSDEVLSEIIYA